MTGAMPLGMRHRLEGFAVIGFAAVALGGCASSADAPHAPGDVVHVRVRLTGGHGFEEQWIELRTGRYRLQSPDGRQWWVYDGRRRFEDHLGDATTLRIGSRRYLGGLATLSVSRVLAAYYLHGSRHEGGTAFVSRHGGRVIVVRHGGRTIGTITIVGGLSSDRADERRLFAIRTAHVTSLSREVRAGARSSLPIAAYWFGPRWQRLSAVTASDDDLRGGAARPAQQVHIVYYEPADAGGRSAAYANSPTPRGEVQVVSLDRGAYLARRKIQTTRGHSGGPAEQPWPSRRTILADGERAVVIPFRYRTVGGLVMPGFYVLTARTLVSVNTGRGMRSALRLADRLRPAG